MRPIYPETVDTTNPARPRELLGMSDDDPLVHFIDATQREGRTAADPLPSILREIEKLQRGDEVLLVRHFDEPAPLRELLSSLGYASWAEERKTNDWYIFFYRPHMVAGAAAYRPLVKPLAAAARAGSSKK